MAMGIERVCYKALETLNSNVDSCCYCQCLRGKRVRRKAFGERSFHEGSGAGMFLRRTQCVQALCGTACTCALGIWLSPVYVRGSADSGHCQWPHFKQWHQSQWLFSMEQCAGPLPKNCRMQSWHTLCGMTVTSK
jgi:hypothetical protein